MQIRLLGGFEVVIDGRRVPSADWRRRQAAALVKLLALAPGRVLHREQVIDALWPRLYVPEATPRLHKAAHYARRALRQPRSLVLSGETVALFPDAEVDVDVDVDAVRFQRLAESARDARTAGAAADAYSGDLLPHDPYEVWTEEPRERLRMLYLRMLSQAGRWHHLANADPTDDSAHLELVRGAIGSGDAHSAAHQLEGLERGLPEVGDRWSWGKGTAHLRDELMDSLRRGRREIVVIGGPAASPGHSTVHSDGDSPYGRLLEALAELCRNDPALSAGAAPIAVVIV